MANAAAGAKALSAEYNKLISNINTLNTGFTNRYVRRTTTLTLGTAWTQVATGTTAEGSLSGLTYDAATGKYTFTQSGIWTVHAFLDHVGTSTAIAIALHQTPTATSPHDGTTTRRYAIQTSPAGGGHGDTATSAEIRVTDAEATAASRYVRLSGAASPSVANVAAELTFSWRPL